MSNDNDSRVYSNRHLWALPNTKKKTATIGISDFLAEELGEIACIDMPLVGDELDMESFCLHLHLSGRIHHLRSPLSGRVLEINDDVQDNSNLIHLDPYKHWLYKMEYDDTEELDLLMSSAQYARFVDQL